MGNERLPKIALNSSQNQLCLKRCWCKDTMAWLNHWGIDENDILQNIDNLKNIITSNFKEKFCCEENLVVNRKLRYYKEVINPNLEDHKYLSVVTSSRQKINIAKIITTLMNSIVKQGVGLILKLHRWKGFDICVRL